MQFNTNDTGALQFMQANQTQTGLLIQGSAATNYPNGYVSAQDRGFQSANYGAQQQIVVPNQLPQEFMRPAVVQDHRLHHVQNFPQSQLISCNSANMRPQVFNNQQVFIRTANGIQFPNGAWMQETEPFVKFAPNTSGQIAPQISNSGQQMQPIQVHIPAQRQTTPNLQQNAQFSNPIQGIPLYKSQIETNAASQNHHSNVQVVNMNSHPVATHLRPQLYQQIIDSPKMQQTVVAAAQQSPNQMSVRPSFYQTSFVGVQHVGSASAGAVYSVPQNSNAGSSIYVVPTSVQQQHQHPGDFSQTAAVSSCVAVVGSSTADGSALPNITGVAQNGLRSSAVSANIASSAQLTQGGSRPASSMTPGTSKCAASVSTRNLSGFGSLAPVASVTQTSTVLDRTSHCTGSAQSVSVGGTMSTSTVITVASRIQGDTTVTSSLSTSSTKANPGVVISSNDGFKHSCVSVEELAGKRPVLNTQFDQIQRKVAECMRKQSAASPSAKRRSPSNTRVNPSAVIVPFGWKRVIENNSVIYYRWVCLKSY